MPGNDRYEEERSRGQRGTTRRGGFGERGRDDDMELDERERYGQGGYNQGGYNQGGYNQGGYNQGGMDQGGMDQGGMNQGGVRQGGVNQGGVRQGGVNRGEVFEGGVDQGGMNQGGGRQRGFNQGGYGEGYGLSRYDLSGYEQGGSGQGTSSRGQRGNSMQADGWVGEPDEMRWGRQQGLYGSTEYAGYISSQRSQKNFQSHVGKGPKGWQRSDERINEEVNEALARHPEIDASDIEVKVQNCEVTLTGTVTEREAKRIAEDVVERVFGVKDVQNQIKVKPDGTSDREVTRNADRDARTGTGGQEAASSRATTANSGITNR